MVPDILIASLMFVTTTAIHAAGMLVVIRMGHLALSRSRAGRQQRPLALLVAVILLLFLVSLAEVGVWAAMYLVVGAISGVERALYFSMVTFTTLGYGDVMPEQDWRLLASFEGANGIIMFGWTTAIVVTVVQRLIRRPGEGDA